MRIMKMGTEKHRKQTINMIRNTFIQAKDLLINEKKLLAQISIVHGVTSRKAKEYVTMLLDSGFIEREGENLFLSKMFTSQDEGIGNNP